MLSLLKDSLTIFQEQKRAIPKCLLTRWACTDSVYIISWMRKYISVIASWDILSWKGSFHLK